MSDETKITLTNKAIYAAVNALQAFDRSDEKGKPFYKFPSPKFRLALSKRLKRLVDARQEVEDQKIKFQKELGLKGDGEDNKAAVESFGTMMRELLNDTETFDMAKLKMSELDLEKNEIPVGVIADLEWLFDDDVSDK